MNEEAETQEVEEGILHALSKCKVGSTVSNSESLSPDSLLLATPQYPFHDRHELSKTVWHNLKTRLLDR